MEAFFRLGAGSGSSCGTTGFPTPVGTAKFQFWMKPNIDAGGASDDPNPTARCPPLHNPRCPSC
uniref:Uncharacterized protein n=1 Tax=Oryza glumipatula TaxID=40148 RepID=A0A0E0ABA1_9ORYZ